METAVRAILESFSGGAVDKPRHLKQVIDLFDEYRSETRLKKMALLMVAAVEVLCVEGIEIVHDLGDGCIAACFQKKLDLVRKQAIGKELKFVFALVFR